MSLNVQISKLKESPLFADILNFLFTSDMLKGTFGWARTKNVEKISKNIPLFRNYPQNFERLVERKMPGSEINANQTLAQIIHEIIHHKISNVYLGKTMRKATTEEEASLFHRYSDISTWAIPGTTYKQPVRKPGVKSLLNLQDLYLIIAINETVNPEILARTNKTLECDIGYNCAQQVLKNLDTAEKEASGKTAQGETAKNACLNAMTFVINHGEKIFDSEIMNYDKIIPPFSHIGYQFSGGYIHHGIYLGSNLVVEVLNLDSKETNKNVKGYITITHIFDFLKRARNNPSELLIFEYENPYPENVIRDRAIWSIGRFPDYHITRQNCESFASWVMTNEFESSMCIILPTAQLQPPTGIRTFTEIMDTIEAKSIARNSQGYQLLLENKPKSGGSRTRKQRRKRHAKQTRSR